MNFLGAKKESQSLVALAFPSLQAVHFCQITYPQCKPEDYKSEN